MTYLARQAVQGVVHAGALLVAAFLAVRVAAERFPELTLQAGVAAVLLTGLFLCRPPAWNRRVPLSIPQFPTMPDKPISREARRSFRTRDGCVWKPVGGGRGTRLTRYGCATCGQVGYAAIGKPPIECLKGRRVPRL